MMCPFVVFLLLTFGIRICPKKTDHWANPDSKNQPPWEGKHVTPWLPPLLSRLWGTLPGLQQLRRPINIKQLRLTLSMNLGCGCWASSLGQVDANDANVCNLFYMSDGLTLSNVFEEFWKLSPLEHVLIFLDLAPQICCGVVMGVQKCNLYNYIRNVLSGCDQGPCIMHVLTSSNHVWLSWGMARCWWRRVLISAVGRELLPDKTSA